LRVPAKGLPLLGNRLDGHDVFDEAVGLGVVVIDEGDQVVQLVVRGGHCGFPRGALLQLAVGEEVEHVEAASLPQPGAQGHADGDRKALPKRAAGHLNAGHVPLGGHAEVALVGAVGGELLLGEDAQRRERGVEDDGVVPGREQKAVPFGPVRPLGVVLHGVKVGGRQDVGGAEALPHVALALALRHAQHVAANLLGLALERFDLLGVSLGRAGGCVHGFCFPLSLEGLGVWVCDVWGARSPERSMLLL
jgi:hypothetical protein